MHRVLRPGGFALHMVPTSAWRFWSLLSHYPALARDVVSYPFRQRPPAAAPALEAPEGSVGGAYGRGAESALAKLSRRLLPRRHGSRGTAIGELTIFSEASWMRHFTHHGWRLEESRRGGMWLTGDMLLGAALPIAFRTKASRVLGSSALMLVMRPAPRVLIQVTNPSKSSGPHDRDEPLTASP